MDAVAVVAVVAVGTAMNYGLKLFKIDVYSTGPFAHSFALPTALTRSAALISSLARSLTRPRAHEKEIYFYVVHCVDFSHSTLCVVVCVGVWCVCCSGDVCNDNVGSDEEENLLIYDVKSGFS